MEIQRAGSAHLEAITALFDQYRVFYGQQTDLSAARTFIQARLTQQDSVILMATHTGAAAGFIQLYPSFSSVSMDQSGF
jgi:hypothetical protein